MAVKLNAEKLAGAIEKITTVFGAKYTENFKSRCDVLGRLSEDDAYRAEILANEKVNEGNRNALIAPINAVLENAQELEEVSKLLASRNIKPISTQDAQGAAEVMDVKKTLRV